MTDSAFGEEEFAPAVLPNTSDTWDLFCRSVDSHCRDIHDIWMVSREYGELAAAGGVKDVVFQLAKSLARDEKGFSR